MGTQGHTNGLNNTYMSICWQLHLMQYVFFYFLKYLPQSLHGQNDVKWPWTDTQGHLQVLMMFDDTDTITQMIKQP